MPRDIQDRPLSGPEKAAIALLSLDEESAAKVLRKMDTKDVQRLTNSVAKLREVPPETVEAIKTEFLSQFMQSQGIDRAQGREKIRSLLEVSLAPEKAQEIIETMEATLESEGIEALKWLDSQSIATFIRMEHPQTMAIILAHMDSDLAAEVLAQIPEVMRADVCIRLATLERISPSVLSELNEVIRSEVLSQGASKGQVAGGVETVAEIINFLDKDTKAKVLNAIEELNQSLSENIRDNMFTFEDLLTLDDRHIREVMKEVQNETLTLSLKSASEEMQKKMLSNISERAAKMIVEDLEVMGPVRLSDVEKAQQEVLAVARRLEEEGKIMLAGKGGGDDFV